MDVLFSPTLTVLNSLEHKASVDLFGVPVHAQTLDEAVQTLIVWAQDAQQHYYVSTCTVYTLMMCCENPVVMQAVSRASMVTADGMPLVWLQRLKGYPDVERVYGPDLLKMLCEATSNQNVRHFFWGGLPGVPEKIASKMQARFPHIQIAGAYSPPVRDVEAIPEMDTINRLNDVNPDVIWVGLGSPKQDLWMSLYRPHLNAALLIGVGAAFDFVSASKPQAPRWMQRMGFEWLFRFIHEPRRLWRRYIIYNARFIWLLLRSTFLR